MTYPMKKLKLYVDTSVIGGLFDIEDAKRVCTADTLLNSIRDGVYEGFISGLTIAEVLGAPAKIHEPLQARIADTGFQLLDETAESISLAEAYLTADAIPQRYRDDARHVAIAVVHDLDYIVSWNYKHMVNISVRRLINSANIRMGYNPIEIISPEEVTGDGEVAI